MPVAAKTRSPFLSDLTSLAYRLDVTGELLPEHGLSRSADAERQPHGHPDPGGEVESPQLAIGRAHRRGADSNQHLVVLRNGLRHVPELKDIRWSVVRAHDCSHAAGLRFVRSLR